MQALLCTVHAVALYVCLRALALVGFFVQVHVHVHIVCVSCPPVYWWYVNNAGFLRVFLYSDHGLTAPSLVLLFFLASFPGTACESTFYYINGCGYVVLQVEIREVTYYICRSSITDEI